MCAWSRTERNDAFYAAFHSLAEKLSLATGWDVIVGLNEFCGPRLGDALDQAVARGADKIMDAIQEKLKIKEGQTTDDLLFSLEAVRCVGCCASGPVITVNQETRGGLDRSNVVEIIEQYRKDAS